MVPCVQDQPPRRIDVRFKDGASKVIRADEILRPATHNPCYVLKRDAKIVAEYEAECVSGWCLEDAGD